MLRLMRRPLYTYAKLAMFSGLKCLSLVLAYLATHQILLKFIPP
jgi:hypothetical protein